MKKIFIKNFLGALLLFVASCSPTDKDLAVVSPSTPPVLTSPKNNENFVLNETKSDSIVTVIKWNAATYNGPATEINYDVQMAVPGTNFTKPVSVILTTDLQKIMLVSELNTAALNLGLKPLETSKIDVRIVSYIGADKKHTQNSNVNTITVKPYATWPNWGIVGTSTPNDWGGPDIVLGYDLNTKLYSYTGNLKVGVIKFRLDNNWKVNYGSNLNNGKLDVEGSNIPITTAGNYIITVDFSKLTYSIKLQ